METPRSRLYITYYSIGKKPTNQEGMEISRHIIERRIRQCEKEGDKFHHVEFPTQRMRAEPQPALYELQPSYAQNKGNPLVLVEVNGSDYTITFSSRNLDGLAVLVAHEGLPFDPAHVSRSIK